MTLAYWLDEGWHSWPEVVRAGTAAAGLYARCGSWIADHCTDGLVPFEVARMYGTAEWAQRLVGVGLWTIEGDGYRDTRYFPLNPSSEVVRKRREQAAERQRRLRQRRNAKPPRESRVTNPGSDGVSSRSPARPLKGAGDARALRVVPDPPPIWCGRCDLDTRTEIDDDDRRVPCSRCHPAA